MLSRAPLHWAAGPFAYTALLCLCAKLARAAELWMRTESPRALLFVPAVLGQDLVLAAAVGLAGYGLGRLRAPRTRLGLTLLLLAPLAVLLPADVVSHVLTGRPLTLQRLRGDEGATLADLNLLESADLLAGGIGIALAAGALLPVLAFGPRASWLRRLSRPRLLVSGLLAGAAVSLAQAALLPHTMGLSEQPVFVLVRSAFERSSPTGLALEDREWRALQTPQVTEPWPPRPPVMGRAPKHMVVFVAEGVPFEATGFDPRFARAEPGGGTPPNPTPHLVRRAAEHGLVFERYYANWHASIQAIFSIVCSAFPPLSGDIVRIKPRIDCGEFSEVLARHDVLPGLFHGGQFAFYNKLALLGRRSYAVELDAEELAKTSERTTHRWGIDDRALADAALAWIDALPRDQRFAALLIPITAHYPYWVPPEFERPFKGSSRRDRFLDAVAFQDLVFEEVIRGFEARGLYEDTLFVWLGDHGHYVGEPARITPGLRGFYEPNLKTPLVLINPRLFPSSFAASERRSARLGSHVDLLPTLLDALGLPPDPRHQGQSLLGADYEPRRVFFGARDGRYVGFIEGDHKFVTHTRRNHIEYYDLSADPDELIDLSSRFPERMERYADAAVRFARGAQARIEAAEVLPETVSVRDLDRLFMQHVQVTHDTGAERVACENERRTTCPGLGRVLRLKTGHVQGEKRRCVMVRVPDAGAIELRIAHRDTLDLLTGTMLAFPGSSSKTRFRISTRADGTDLPSVLLTRRGAVRPLHPRAQSELRFAIERISGSGSRPKEVCLQLTALVAK